MNKLCSFLIFLFVIFLSVRQVEAAIGDIGIWRDSAGVQIPGTSFAAMNFATEQRNDGDYTFTGNNTLELDVAGNYLLIATVKYTNDSNGRFNPEARFSYSGSGDFVTLYGSGYSRNNNNDEAWFRVVGLVWGNAADDTVQLEVRRDSDAPTNGTIADASHFMVVRLQDSAAVGMYTDTTDTAAYGTTSWADVPYNNTVLENDTDVIEIQSGDTDIRLKKDDTTFLVGYGIAFGTGGTRTQRISRMVEGSSGIEQSYSYEYLRSTSDEYADPNGIFLYRNSGTSTDLSVQAQRGEADSAGNGARRTSTSGMFVVELPATADVYISHDSTGGQDIGGTSGDFTAMTVDYNDSNSFTNVNSSTMNIEQDMDVLLMGQIHANRDTGTGNVRMTTAVRFEINGSDQILGENGNYMRGNQVGAATYDIGLTPIGVYSASNGDDVQMEWYDHGDNGEDDDTVADEVGFCALNLDTLEMIISVSIDDGVVSYGGVPEGSNEDTTSSGLDDSQTATNDSNVTVTFNIKGQDSSSWTLEGTAGSEQYTHEWCTSNCDSSPVWNNLTTSYQTLDTGVAVSGTTVFDLQIGPPTSTVDYTQQSVDITVQAVAE